MVRIWFTVVTAPAGGREGFDDIPPKDADILNLAVAAPGAQHGDKGLLRKWQRRHQQQHCIVVFSSSIVLRVLSH
ncbi:hypothetical protein HaLaN_06631 [Haematococcus lacustris]|uniref:Uncharacterized protein n=1 Tax=Haematococcus lacustris TaxID=44745 RepID=A0A699YWG8_HAELA|nr:hypothetical protein HaLaN_06631 [Haematococcus lacustris]